MVSETAGAVSNGRFRAFGKLDFLMVHEHDITATHEPSVDLHSQQQKPTHPLFPNAIIPSPVFAFTPKLGQTSKM